jgi:hypothetical protein
MDLLRVLWEKERESGKKYEKPRRLFFLLFRPFEGFNQRDF